MNEIFLKNHFTVLCAEFILLNRLFHIRPGIGKSNGEVLLCEFSHHHLCLAAAHQPSKEITSLSYFESVTPLTAQDFTDALQQWQAGSYEKMVVASAFPEVVLLPEHLFLKKRAADLLQTGSEPVKDPVYYNVLDDQNVVVVYSIPKHICEKIESEKLLKNTHVYTCQLQQRESFAQDQIFVHFESREFRVLARKDQQVLIAQTYFYTAPLDVIYYLLAICREFDLSQSATAIVLSGLVAEDSSLYKELHHYFTQIHFATAAEGMPEHHYPPHFFSALHNLALCVL